MGHKYRREDMLEAAVDVALSDGLAALTFGSVARHLRTSDRMVVYYFPSKADLVIAVLGELGVRVQAALAPAMTGRALGHLDVVRAAWPVLAQPAHDRTFALFFEAMGLAASGREPYRSVAPPMIEAWVQWAASLLDGPARHRHAEASAAIATLDGMLLMRLTAGADAADRAAAALVAGSGQSA